MKFWRSDSKGGKSYWMDIGETRILLMNSVPFSTTSSSSQSTTQVRTSGNVSTSRGSSSISDMRTSSKTVQEERSESKLKSKPKSKSVDESDEDNDDKEIVINNTGMTDTYVSCQSLQAALCASGISCR